MIVIEITKKGIQRALLKHATQDEETEDFIAYQVIKPRLMALHAALKDHFKKEMIDAPGVTDKMMNDVLETEFKEGIKSE